MRGLPLKVSAVMGCAILMAVGSSLPGILAQNDMPAADYVIEGEYIAGFQWLADGSGLKVVDNIDTPEQRIELDYSLQTQQARPSSDLLLSQNPDLLNTSAVEGRPEQNLSSMVYVSPDKQWAAYATPENEGYSLTLYQFDTGQIRIMSEASIMLPHNAYRFSVKRSDDSSAFYIRNRNGPVTYWYYVHGFEHKLEEAHVVVLHDRRGPFQRAVIGFSGAFDIDPTGDFMLMELDSYIDNIEYNNLVILNMSDFSSTSLLVTRSIIAASFGNGNEIFYISSEGMYVYDLEAGTSRLLNPNINSSWIQDVEISPDGRYIAATKGGDTDSLYIIPVTTK